MQITHKLGVCLSETTEGVPQQIDLLRSRRPVTPKFIEVVVFCLYLACADANRHLPQRCYGDQLSALTPLRQLTLILDL